MRATGMGKLNVMAIAVALAMGTVCISRDVQAQTQTAEVRSYDIPAGKLSDSLKWLGMQSRLQLLAPPELTRDLRGKSVSGAYTASQALDQLLAGSGLSYEFVNATTVVIKKSSGPAPGKTKSSSGSSGSAGAKTAAKSEPTELSTVTVTGTRIRGGTSASPVITIDAQNIREEGFTDLGEVIRSIPQNFSGGQNPGVYGAFGSIANQNITGGSGLNLRGLGPDASLTLLNGRRLSYGGSAQAVDISAIPVEAVERIEIVADGASAIYGSDAVGGVGNVILKRDFDGITVGTRYGTTADGGLTTREYTATGGATWSGGGLIATYKDTSTDPIYSDQRDYTKSLYAPQTIYPGSDSRSGLLSAHQFLGDFMELHLDALRTERDSLKYNAGATVYYQYLSKTTTSLMSPSIEFSLPKDWNLSVGGTWGKDEFVSGSRRFITATGAAATAYIPTCYCNASRSYEIGAEGPLFTLGGGDARLAVGAGYRSNAYLERNQTTGVNGDNGDESSRFGYAELSLPLIGGDSDIAGAKRLVLTAAVRGEDYNSFGVVATPKLGLIYDPSDDFTLKASWGKSFKAPTLLQKYQSTYAFLEPSSTLGGVGYPADATAMWLGGGNPDLKAERAQTWSTSLAFHPAILPGLDAELTYFNINYVDRVVPPISSSSRALSDSANDPFIIYTPTADQLAEIIANYKLDNYTGAVYDPSKVVAIATNNYTNVLGQRIKGIDLSGSYRFDLRNGQLTMRGSASWLDSSQRTITAQNDFDLAGTLFNPARLNSRIAAIWTQGGFTASIFANYTGGVIDNINARKTASFTTIDTTLRYTTNKRSGILSGLEISLSAQNLFNRAPPFYKPLFATYVPYDSTNYSAIGRLMNVSVSKHW